MCISVFEKRAVKGVRLLSYWFFCKIIIWIISVCKEWPPHPHLAIFFGRWLLLHHHYHLYFFVNVLIYSNSVRPSSIYFFLQGFLCLAVFFVVACEQGQKGGWGIFDAALSQHFWTLWSWRMQMRGELLFPLKTREIRKTHYNLIIKTRNVRQIERDYFYNYSNCFALQ